MRDFVYYAPTKVVFGRGKETEVGELIKGYGFKKIMMQYGKDSIKKSGLYDRVIKSLADAGISVVEMGGVEPNPKVEFVRKAAELAKNENVELILAVGGGSVIDSVKSTAGAVAMDCDPWDLHTRKVIPTKALPVATILTHSAAGSEMSGNAVITNMAENMKRGCGSPCLRPLFSILNPELTFTVSKYQTACGVVDIMAHTMERYFTVCEPTPLTDRIAEGVLKSVVEAAKIVIDNPCDYDARATIMWASSVSHNDLTSCGRENFLAVHQLEHALSGEFDKVAHGAGLAVLYPAWARYVYKENIPRFAQFARNVWDVTEVDDEKAAIMGIEWMAEFFKSIGMPSKISEFDIPSGFENRFAELTTFGKTRTVKSYIELGYDEIVDIFKMCY